MNSKHMGKWVIVLLLLAALPGMTAVMAQGEEPTTQEPLELELQAPTVAIPWYYTETKPNNTINTAEPFKQVHGGMISAPGDIDFFLVDVPMDLEEMDTNQPILIDVDTSAQLSTQPDTIICLYKVDDSGAIFELACSDNTDTQDPMLYFNLETYYSRWDTYYPQYYVSVRSVDPNQGGEYNYRYHLLISYPLLISAAAGGLGTGTVNGISFQAGDILAWSKYGVNNQVYERWVMLLDLSDLGVKGNIANIAAGWRNSDYLLLGFAANVTLPGVAIPMKPWDVVLFDPQQVGPATQGNFQAWWVGAPHGLTTAAEKIDAIDWPEWRQSAGTRLYVSTTGTAKVPKGPTGSIALPDEDIGTWTEKPAPERWSRFFDGSSVQGMGVEDVIAFSTQWGCENCAYHDAIDFRAYDMVIQGSARCGADQVYLTQKDIVRHLLASADGPDGYESMLHPCQRVWYGPDHGWNYNIDAIDYHNWDY